MRSGNLKYIIGSILILAAVIFLIVTSMNRHAEYFMTVDELKAGGEAMIGQRLRISGAVIGSTIQYDPETLNLSFDIAHVSGDNAEVQAQGGLAAVLHESVNDPARARITITYHGVRPDLLQDEAQAVVTGALGDDGAFHADELLLKCPTKYEQSLPEQAVEP